MRAALQKVVDDFNLDINDPFTRIIAAAFAFQDERDEAHRILREVNAELARLYTVRDELMTRAEKAEAECLRLNHAEAEAMSVVLSNEGQIDALRHDLARAQETATTLATENEALRRDAERYRWLRSTDIALTAWDDLDGTHWSISTRDWNVARSDLDAAIDAARKEQTK